MSDNMINVEERRKKGLCIGCGEPLTPENSGALEAMEGWHNDCT